MIGIFVGILSIIVCIIVIIALKKKFTRRTLDEIQQYKTFEFQKERKKYLERLDEDFSDARQVRQEQLNSLDKEIENKKEFNDSLLKIREKELDSLIEEKRIAKQIQLNQEIEEWARSAQEAANEYQKSYSAQLQSIIKANEEKLQETLDALTEYKEKRNVVNQEILRARALEEKQDFYRIQLDAAVKKDLALINSIRSQFSKIDLLDKLLYDICVKKPVDEMVKRVLGGRAPSGIYKITRLKTGEIYIGQSTDIKARWQQHARSAFHCGTISHSILHTTIERDGIDQFTWELLEEVPKDKLRERERYWIEFYDSKNFGLNMREG